MTPTPCRNVRLLFLAVFAGAWVSCGRGAETPPVSYFKDVLPIFKRSCTGCHQPARLKGDLDLTTYPAFAKGGKHGPVFKAGDPAHSRLVDEIKGPDPNMPKEGDPLSAEEVALMERWITAGATDDTPEGAFSFKLKEPPLYPAPPVISALACSPDGKLLAVTGYHEVFLYDATDLTLVARLVGEAPRLESLCFSPDNRLLAVAGGAPARFGEIQLWDTATHAETKAYKLSTDCLYGVAFSPDGQRLSLGGADKLVRVIAVSDGKELLKFDNHSDWVFSTLFTLEGKRLLSGSRDRAMKLIDVANGQFIDDINKLLEGVLCMARHPREDVVAYGGDLGTPRVYRIAENQGRTAANNDANLLREFERQPGPVRAIAYSPDASLLAVAGAPDEVRVYRTADGTRASTLPDHNGPVFALAFRPGTDELVTGGFDGLVRVFHVPSGRLAAVFTPVPVEADARLASTISP